mgnify:CR=1 FL=1
MENISRTKVLGRSVIIRRRIIKRKPWRYSRRKCFHKFDAGKWSFYVSLRKPRKAVNFGKIVDK